MVKRTIVGRLDADPEIAQHERVRLRVIETTGGHLPTTHHVEAKLALAHNVAASLHASDAVIVVGDEHTIDWDDDAGVRQHGRMIDAEHIGPDLSRVSVSVARKPGPR